MVKRSEQNLGALPYKSTTGPNRSSLTHRQQQNWTDPAAVVRAAQGWDRFGASRRLVQAHGAGGGGARQRLRVPALEAGGHDELVGVVGVALHQQVHVPPAVDQEVLGPVQIHTESG